MSGKFIPILGGAKYLFLGQFPHGMKLLKEATLLSIFLMQT